MLFSSSVFTHTRTPPEISCDKTVSEPGFSGKCFCSFILNQASCADKQWFLEEGFTTTSIRTRDFSNKRLRIETDHTNVFVTMQNLPCPSGLQEYNSMA